MRISQSQSQSQVKRFMRREFARYLASQFLEWEKLNPDLPCEAFVFDKKLTTLRPVQLEWIKAALSAITEDHIKKAWKRVGLQQVFYYVDADEDAEEDAESEAASDAGESDDESVALVEEDVPPPRRVDVAAAVIALELEPPVIEISESDDDPISESDDAGDRPLERSLLADGDFEI